MTLSTAALQPTQNRMRLFRPAVRRPFVVVGVAAVAVAAGTLPAHAVSTESANTRIAKMVSSRLHDSVLGGRTAVRVFDTATGHTIYTKASTSSFRVASNTKIVTAATALQTMGPAHRFPTTVMLGRPGHVYLVGGGDPLLASSNLRSLAAKAASVLKKRGQKSVRVHLDDSLFSGWGGLPSGFDHYCGSPHGFRGYCIAPVRALTYDRRYGRDNARDAAAYFTRYLNAASGIAAKYSGRATTPYSVTGIGGITGAAGPSVVARYAGHRLDDVIRHMFFVSDDEIAETLFRHVALATGRTPSMAGGRAAQRAVLSSLGVPLGGVVTSSGSGRSSHDRFTAVAMVTMLRKAVDGDHPRMAALRNGTSETGGKPLLMRAGIDGTLHTSYGRYSTSPSSCARGKVYAKTGSLSDAITLSGYAKGADGHWKVFAVFVNSRPTAYSALTTRQHVDRIAATVTGCY